MSPVPSWVTSGSAGRPPIPRTIVPSPRAIPDQVADSARATGFVEAGALGGVDLLLELVDVFLLLPFERVPEPRDDFFAVVFRDRARTRCECRGHLRNGSGSSLAHAATVGRRREPWGRRPGRAEGPAR